MIYSKYCRDVLNLQLFLKTLDKERYIDCVPDMKGGFVVIYK